MKKQWFLLGIVTVVVLTATLGAHGMIQSRQKESADVLADQVLQMISDLRALRADLVIEVYSRKDEYVHIENGREIPWSQLEQGIRSYLGSVKKNELYWIGRPKVLMLGPDGGCLRASPVYRRKR